MSAKVKIDDVQHLLTPGQVADAKGHRRSKYRNHPVEYRGVRYDSKAEARRAQELDGLKESGKVRHWFGQVLFRLGVPENRYRVDFVVVAADGSVHAEDVKGMETAKFRRDAKLWRRYGEMPLWVIKGRQIEVIEGQAS